MAKKEKPQSVREPYLIDVAPKNHKAIAEAAKRCRAAQSRKAKAAEQETVEKDKLLALVKKSDLKPINGKIIFRSEGLLVTMTPREDAIQIKEKSDD